ncbi:MAG: hypothetical protein ABSE41_11565 [Bacteroidota bacterium]
MPRWDVISWWATGIFVLSAVLAAALQNDAFLFLMVGSYMLRPTLYAMGIATKYGDERQMSIQYRSGNLALTIVIVAIIVFAIKARVEGKPADDFNVLLIVALAARALIGVLMIGDHKAVGVRISVGVGSLWLLFVLAENGLTLRALPEASPGILMLLLGLLGKHQPRISGAVFAILAVAAAYFIGFRTGHGFTFYQAITALLVSLPLAVSAFYFLKGTSPE